MACIHYYNPAEEEANITLIPICHNNEYIFTNFLSQEQLYSKSDLLYASRGLKLGFDMMFLRFLRLLPVELVVLLPLAPLLPLDLLLLLDHLLPLLLPSHCEELLARAQQPPCTHGGAEINN